MTAVEKLAKEHYPEYYSAGLGVDRIGFERGYNLAKETQLPKEISDGAKDTADYIDRHIIESMKELAKEGFKPKQEISDEEIDKSISYDSKEPYVEGFINGAKWYREQLKNK